MITGFFSLAPPPRPMTETVGDMLAWMGEDAREAA